MKFISIRINFNILLFQVQITLLNIERIVISPKYANYINICLPKFIVEVFKDIDIYNRIIKLINDKKPLIIFKNNCQYSDMNYL